MENIHDVNYTGKEHPSKYIEVYRTIHTEWKRKPERNFSLMFMFFLSFSLFFDPLRFRFYFRLLRIGHRRDQSSPSLCSKIQYQQIPQQHKCENMIDTDIWLIVKVTFDH